MMNHLRKKVWVVPFLSLCAFSCATPNYLTDYEAQPASDLIHAVVEIPAGTNEKWEVHQSCGCLKPDVREGKVRVVEYLGYPANYGMIPRTNYAKSIGGDGDPLDVLVLGPSLQRGTLIAVKPIGLLKMKTGEGEDDSKLIAVSQEGLFAKYQTINELESDHAGIKMILETWFQNYKGPGMNHVYGFGSPEEAKSLLRKAVSQYSTQHPR